MHLIHHMSHWLGRYVRNKDATTALEFGIIALPFFVLFLAIFETCLMIFAASVLEAGVAAAARQIRTGEVQANSITQQQFRDMVCNGVAPLLGCNDQLMVDVRQFSGFGGVNFEPRLNPQGRLQGNPQFQPGGAGDVVLVRAYYIWPMITPLGDKFTNMDGNNRLLEASTTFRNEPFGSSLN